MIVHITAERPDTIDAQTLIAELDAHLGPLYPSESRHGFSVDKLIREEVAFFVMRYNEELAGCGGVKIFSADDGLAAYAEIKRMYVRPHLRGNGLAKRMLEHLTNHARQQRIDQVRSNEPGTAGDQNRGISHDGNSAPTGSATRYARREA